MTKESAPPPYVDRLRPICPTLSRVPGELQWRPPTLTAPKWERVKRFLTSIFSRFENFCVPYKVNSLKYILELDFDFVEVFDVVVKSGLGIQSFDLSIFNLSLFSIFEKD